MYPATYFSLFPPFPRENKVFVAMSFDARFEHRWQKVIAPAIQNISSNGVALEPHRVDIRHVSDSILTEILTAIASYQLIFADISTIGYLDGKPIRNSNVMYELGLAQVSRLPEEIIIFRSDNDVLPFDIANVRINTYDPDTQPDNALQLVQKALIDTSREIDLKRHLAVKTAAESLDYISWEVLMDAIPPDMIEHPITQNINQMLANSGRLEAINRLLELRAIQTQYISVSKETFTNMMNIPLSKALKYRITPFGEAIIEYIADYTGILNPELRPLVDKFVQSRLSSDGKQ